MMFMVAATSATVFLDILLSYKHDDPLLGSFTYHFRATSNNLNRTEVAFVMLSNAGHTAYDYPLHAPESLFHANLSEPFNAPVYTLPLRFSESSSLLTPAERAEQNMETYLQDLHTVLTKAPHLRDTRKIVLIDTGTAGAVATLYRQSIAPKQNPRVVAVVADTPYLGREFDFDGFATLRDLLPGCADRIQTVTRQIEASLAGDDTARAGLAARLNLCSVPDVSGKDTTAKGLFWYYYMGPIVRAMNDAFSSLVPGQRGGAGEICGRIRTGSELDDLAAVHQSLRTLPPTECYKVAYTPELFLGSFGMHTQHELLRACYGEATFPTHSEESLYASVFAPRGAISRTTFYNACLLLAGPPYTTQHAWVIAQDHLKRYGDLNTFNVSNVFFVRSELDYKVAMAPHQYRPYAHGTSVNPFIGRRGAAFVKQHPIDTNEEIAIKKLIVKFIYDMLM